MKRRSWLWVSGLLVCALVAVLGPAGSAGGAPVNNPPGTRCNTDGRLFCIDITTFSGITASDPARSDGNRYTWVEWKVTNTGGSTLTNPRVTVSLEDLCGAVDCASVTSEFVLPATPNACSGSTSTITCTYPNIPATNPDSFTPLTRIYFKTADAPATSTRIEVQATVKERGNDQGGGNVCPPGDPNCDTHATSVVNVYEPDPNAAYTFVLNNEQFFLETNDKRSAFGFRSDSPSIFQSLFVVDTSGCGTAASPTCFQRTLNATTDPLTTEYNDGPVLFYARVTNPPSGVNANNVVAIHTQDDGDVVTIGDQNSERSNAGCVFAFPNTITVPSICAKKVQGTSQAIDVWVWDSENGRVGFG